MKQVEILLFIFLIVLSPLPVYGETGNSTDKGKPKVTVDVTTKGNPIIIIDVPDQGNATKTVEVTNYGDDTETEEFSYHENSTDYEDVTDRTSDTFSAESTEPEYNTEVRSAFDAFFDMIGDFGKAQTESSTWFDDEKKEQIDVMTDSGVETGKTAIELFWNFHHFIINIVFAGSPVPFDIGIAIMISFILSIIIVVFLFRDFIKRSWKIFAILGIIIALIMISGIQAPTI